MLAGIVRHFKLISINCLRSKMVSGLNHRRRSLANLFNASLVGDNYAWHFHGIKLKS